MAGAAYGQGQGVSGLPKAPPAGFSSDGVHVPLVSPSPLNPWLHSASSLGRTHSSLASWNPSGLGVKNQDVSSENSYSH